MRYKAALLIFLSSLFITCKSIPIDFSETITHSLPLDTGASVYIIADAKEGRPLMELLPVAELENKQVQQIIDQTDFFAIAVFPEESKRQIQIVALGNYQSRMANLGLAFNKHWKRQRSGEETFWHSTEGNFSIAINPRQVFVSSHHGDIPQTPFADALGTPLPEGFGKFSNWNEIHQYITTNIDIQNDSLTNKPPISFWIENPAPMLNTMLGDLSSMVQIPAQKLFISLFPMEDQYQAAIQMQFATVSQARGISGAIALVRNFVGNYQPEAPEDEDEMYDMIFKLFFANPPVLEDQNIIFKTGLLTGSEISLLLGMFLGGHNANL